MTKQVKRKYYLLGYSCIALSCILFIAGVVTFSPPHQWEYDKIDSLMQNATIGYVIVASFCFVGVLTSAGHGNYKTSVTLALLPTIVSFCFLLFANASEYNATTWLLLFLSSLPIYPMLYFNKKTTN